MKPPAFQFYADDFLAGTMHFTDAEAGLYVRLLCAQWSAGSLPNDETELRTYARGRTPLKRVLAKFTVCVDGRLRNARLEAERAKQAAFREKQAKKGRRSGESRRTTVEPRLNHGSAPVPTEHEPEGNSPVSSLQSPVSITDHDPGLAAPQHTPPAPPSGENDVQKKEPKASPPRPTTTDDVWIAEIEAMDAFKPLNIRQELGKAQLWASTHNRVCTRKFFTNWLNRALGDVRTVAAKPAREIFQEPGF